MKHQFYVRVVCMDVLYILLTVDIGQVYNKMGDSSSDSSSDDDICDYERKRLKNIRENWDLLRSLGKSRVCI